MTHENTNLDPVQGLVDYVNDIKPYHSKVIEALIEYVGIENLQVNIIENFQMGIDFFFEFDGVFICVNGGFGSRAFGDPENIPILSPDPTKSVVEYPAFGNGFFIVLGDKTKLFDPLVNLDFTIMSFIDDKLVDVSASVGSPPTSGAFSIIGDKTAEFPIGTIFNIVGSAANDKSYITTNVAASGTPLRTTISVNGQTVNSESVAGFARRADTGNTGIVIVTTSTYNRSLFTPHTTVFVTGLSMIVPTLEDDNQRFVSLVNIKPLEYTKILSYSNHLKSIGTGSPVEIRHVPDEGVVYTEIIDVSLSPSGFTVIGDYEVSNLYVGDELTVQSSSGNNGVYIITSISTTNGGSPAAQITTFGVATIPDMTVDGIIKLNIPSNVFIVQDDYTQFFAQGSSLDVTTGSKVGTYTVLKSKFYNNATHIRVMEDLLIDGEGTLIVSVTGSPVGIVVDGNVEDVYKQNQQFNIIRSLRNNGSYTTAVDSIYDFTTNTTTITIIEPFDGTDASGEIHEFVKGDLLIHTHGFGETPELCDVVPATLVHINIIEQLEIDSLPITVNENPIIQGIILPPQGFVADATFREDLNILDGGYSFNILSTTTPITIVISDPTGSIYTTFTTGSPVDDSIEIINSVGSPNNNGQYTIAGVSQIVGISTTLTVDGPLITTNQDGVLLYQRWFQYLIVNTTLNTILVLGDATNDISNGNIIKIAYSGEQLSGSPPSYSGSPQLSNNGMYTVNATPIFNGNNTIISVAENLPLLGDSGSWVESI